MSRPRTFSLSSVIAVAKELFWRRGYEGTAISDVEEAAGLSRSSLYQAFGSKEALFEASLEEYITTFMGPLLSPMESPSARPADVQAFFAKLAARFRGDPDEARKGCLWVNSIAEFSGRHPPLDDRAAAYRQRLYDAFSNALNAGEPSTGPDRALARSRSRMLVATTFGLWLAARIDPAEAALLCDGVRAEVRSW